MFISEEGKQLYKYYRLHEKKFHLYLNRVRKTADEENIHEFRRSLKKIKGILRLLELMDSKFNTTEHLEPLKNLFKPAGSIREAQVNLKRLHELSINENRVQKFIEEQIEFIIKKRKSFVKKVKKYDDKTLKGTRKSVKNTCQTFSKDFILSKVLDFLKKRKSLILQLAKNKMDIDGIHVIRIKLKETSTILGLINALSLNGLSKNTLKQLKVYEDAMGLWHDKLILRIALEKHLNKYNLYRTYIHDIVTRLREEEAIFYNNFDTLVEGAIENIEAPITTLSSKI